MRLCARAAASSGLGQALGEWRAGEVVETASVGSADVGRWFAQRPISDDVFARMFGRIFPDGCRAPCPIGEGQGL